MRSFLSFHAANANKVILSACPPKEDGISFGVQLPTAQVMTEEMQIAHFPQRGQAPAMTHFNAFAGFLTLPLLS
jgi:hypothetical protein